MIRTNTSLLKQFKAPEMLVVVWSWVDLKQNVQ